MIGKVVSIKKIRCEDEFVYNLEINAQDEQNKNYFADKVLVSNCHRMSAESNDALLKLIEEPPTHCRFILSTTDIQKLKPTVLSRCQRHDFRKIYWSKISDRLAQIAKSENIDVEIAALNLCAKMADGSMRSALQHLEKLASFSDGKITLADAQKMFGSASELMYFDLVDQIIGDESGAADSTVGFRIIGSMLAAGADFVQIYSDIADHLRNIMVGLTSSKPLEFISLSEEGRFRLKEQLEKVNSRGSLEGVLESISKLNNARLSVERNLPPETALQLWFLESVFAMRKSR